MSWFYKCPCYHYLTKKVTIANISRSLPHISCRKNSWNISPYVYENDKTRHQTLYRYTFSTTIEYRAAMLFDEVSADNGNACNQFVTVACYTTLYDTRSSVHQAPHSASHRRTISRSIYRHIYGGHVERVGVQSSVIQWTDNRSCAECELSRLWSRIRKVTTEILFGLFVVSVVYIYG